MGDVQGDWEKEENCPKTSPLTPTGITKGPKNKGKGSQVEAVQEEEESAELQQLHLEGETIEPTQRQRSVVMPQIPGCSVDNPSTHGIPLSHIKRPIHE